MTLAKLRQSDVLAIGSSRTQQFQEEYFASSFTCACLVAHDLTGVEASSQNYCRTTDLN